MWTVTQLARHCGLSRSTILYYEEIGLLLKARRTPANYRAYSDAELARLRQICVYREAGLKLADISSILSQPRSDAAAVLERRFVELNAEIERLRDHQRAIAQLLKASGKFRRTNMITKEKWIAIMQSAGFTAADMRRWHHQFETTSPEEHQEFLEFLHIGKEEIRSIRESSRAAPER